jgi:hypothetical protein
MILWIKLLGLSLCLGLCWTAAYFILFRTEKERSPSVFATGSLRYSCVPASRGALGHGPPHLYLNPPLVVMTTRTLRTLMFVWTWSATERAREGLIYVRHTEDAISLVI